MIHVQIDTEEASWRVTLEKVDDREDAVAQVAAAIEEGEVICATRTSAMGNEERFVRFIGGHVVVSAATEPTIGES